jgi:hypothetical protein
MVLVYGGCEDKLDIRGYVDASFNIDPDNKKSETGYVFLVNGGAVSWRSGKQSLVAKAIMESEYMVAEAANEAVSLQKFVIELGVFPRMRNHVHIFCDHMVTIADTKKIYYDVTMSYENM